MNQDKALTVISQALEKALKQHVAITPETDLIGEDILDSLDSMVFLLELEGLTGKKFSEDVDLVEAGYYKVSKLISLLAE